VSSPDHYNYPPTASPLSDRARSAFERFCARVFDLGGSLVEHSPYVNSRTSVELRCALGHDTRVLPSSLLRGVGFCKVCAGNDQKSAERAFFGAVEAQGGQRLETSLYKNAKTRVPVRCAQGHLCSPVPGEVKKGGQICVVCSRRDPEATAQACFDAARAQGAQLTTESVYRNNKAPIPMLCAKGHACTPTANHILRGQGICRICARNDPATAEAEFFARARALGATRTENSRYVNANTPVELRCSAGHLCTPAPSRLQQGRGLCEQCTVIYDRVYLLTHPRARAIKVGIASGEYRAAGHCGRGYQLVAQWTGLAHDQARRAEQVVLTRWKQRGYEPVPHVPKDGSTETAPLEHLEETRELLVRLLGPADAGMDISSQGTRDAP